MTLLEPLIRPSLDDGPIGGPSWLDRNAVMVAFAGCLIFWAGLGALGYEIFR